MTKFKLIASITLALAILVHNINVLCVSVPDDSSSGTPSPPLPPVMGHSEITKNILNQLKINENPLLTLDRPNETTHVKVNMYVRNVEMKNSNKLNFDSSKPWTLELTLRQYWNDPRLVYVHPTDPNNERNTHLTVNHYSVLKSIWKPDLFFPEATKADLHFVTTPNTFLWLYPNGDIVYSVRISLTMRCRQTSALKFGHGIGTPIACPVRIASYAYTADQLSLEWVDQDPIEVPESLYEHLDKNYCSLDKVKANATFNSKTRTGKYSSLPAEFEFLC